MLFGLGFNLSQYIKEDLAEAKSKEQEKELFEKDIERLKKTINTKGLSEDSTMEILIRLLYAHMFGYNIEFCYGFLVTQTQSSSYKIKRLAFELSVLAFQESS